MAKAVRAKRAGGRRGPGRPRKKKTTRRRPKHYGRGPAFGVQARIRSVCAGRTFDEISAATGVHWETVRRQVRGISKPSTEFITSLCLAFDVSADWLLCGLGRKSLRR